MDEEENPQEPIPEVEEHDTGTLVSSEVPIPPAQEKELIKSMTETVGEAQTGKAGVELAAEIEKTEQRLHEEIEIAEHYGKQRAKMIRYTEVWNKALKDAAFNYPELMDKHWDKVTFPWWALSPQQRTSYYREIADVLDYSEDMAQSLDESGLLRLEEGKYADISGFQWIRRPELEDVVSRPGSVRGFAKRTPPTLRGPLTPMDILEQSINWQYRQAPYLPIPQGSEHYRFEPSGTSLLSPEVLEAEAKRLREPTEGVRKVVLDIETPSFEKTHGVRQIAARYYDEEGKVVKSVNVPYRNPVMAFGYMPGAQPVEDFVASRAAPTGANIAEVIRDMTNYLGDSGRIVGQNVKFDIGMLAEQLRSSGDPEHEKLAQGLLEHLKKAHDTRLSAQAHFAQQGVILPVAKELQAREMYTTGSISNILLETNLLEEMQKEAVVENGRASGLLQEIRNMRPELQNIQSMNEAVSVGGVHYDSATQFLIRNLHDADIDSLITMQMDRYRNNSGWIAKSMPDKAWRQVVADSSALTPWTFINPESKDIRDLLHGLLSTTALSEEEIKAAKVTPFQYMVLTHRKDFQSLVEKTSEIERSKKVHNAIYSNKLRDLMDSIFYKPETGKGLITSTGQVMLEQELPTIEAESLLSPSGWRKFQEQLAEQGMPYSYLSFPERVVSSLLGEKSGNLFGRYLPELRFMPTQVRGDIAKVAQSGRVIMEPSLLQEVGILPEESIFQAGADLTPTATRKRLIRIEPFKYQEEVAAKAGEVQAGMRDWKNLGLNVEVTKPEASKLFDKINDILHQRANSSLEEAADSSLSEVAESLKAFISDARRTKMDISIGTFGPITGSEGAGEAYDIIQSLLRGGSRATESSNIPNPYVIFGGMDRGQIVTGPVMIGPSTKYMSDELLTATAQQMTETRDLVSRSTNRTAGIFQYLEEYPKVRQFEERFAGALDKYVSPKRAGAAAIVGAGLLAAHYYRDYRKQSKRYNEPLEQMPIESPGKRLPAYAYGPATQIRQDFLATAGLVDSSYNNRNRHTSMAPNKYSYLFGGA